jgi:fumarate hydratase, class II
MTRHDTPHRVERDSMGEVQVPRDALFGAQTRRALDNFPISDLRKPRRFVQALGAIKLEAANVNHELGLLDENLRDAIVQAAEEVMEGELDGHFVLDVFQTGSGTSTNMNANEVSSVPKSPSTPTTTSTWASPRTTSSPPPYTSRP